MNLTTSSEIGKLATALARAQGGIRNAAKPGVNPHFRSKYATLSSLMDACREDMVANEIAVIQSPEANGATVSVVTMLAHSSGEWMRGEITVTARDASPQAVGSAITYCRRYALAAMIGVAPDDDDGEAAQPRAPHPGVAAAAVILKGDVLEAEVGQALTAISGANSKPEMEALSGSLKALVEKYPARRSMLSEAYAARKASLKS